MTSAEAEAPAQRESEQNGNGRSGTAREYLPTTAQPGSGVLDEAVEFYQGCGCRRGYTAENATVVETDPSATRRGGSWVLGGCEGGRRSRHLDGHRQLWGGAVAAGVDSDASARAQRCRGDHQAQHGLSGRSGRVRPQAATRWTDAHCLAASPANRAARVRRRGSAAGWLRVIEDHGPPRGIPTQSTRRGTAISAADPTRRGRPRGGNAHLPTTSTPAARAMYARVTSRAIASAPHGDRGRRPTNRPQGGHASVSTAPAAGPDG